MSNHVYILHLEDDRADAELIQASLEAAELPCRITRVDTKEAFVSALHNARVDLILADYTLPEYDGISALQLTLELHPHIPFIFVSGTIGEDVAIECLTKGATDYVPKLKLERLAHAVRRAMSEANARRELILAEEERSAHLMFFKSMDRVNQAIQGTDSLEQMMSDVLDTVLELLDCDRAYLLDSCDSDAEAWTSPMERCKPKYPGIHELGISLPVDADMAETCRILLESDGPVAFGPGTEYPLPREIANQFNVKSFLSMALLPKSDKPWQFGVHQCSYDRIWTLEETRLFREIGRRLSDAFARYAAYRDLRKSEEFLSNIVENVPNMLFVKDADTLKFVGLNKAGEQLLGQSRKALIGRTDYDFFPKEIADFFTTKDRQVLASKELVDIPEEIIQVRNNEERILHTKKIPILDETGAPRYLLGISEDITESKMAAESIRKLSQAVEQSPVSIVITDTNGRIEFVNAKFIEITGYSQSEALGENPRILKSGETSDEEYRQLWDTISKGGVWQGEFHNRRKDGELYWEQATIAPVRNAENAITHYLAVKEDITAHKQLLDQLFQTQKMEAIGHLAGGIAHDFNNMLGVIIGYTEMLLDMEYTDESLHDYLAEILAASQRSAEVTRQLLAFARRQAVKPKILDLNKTVEGMLKLLRRLIGEDIELIWLPGEKTWPIKIDPSQIDQILANLCVNAKDAIAGVGKVTIETEIVFVDAVNSAEYEEFSQGEYNVLTVTDDGKGMDKSTMERIFEPFFTTKQAREGTGLGLATVYGIVKQNGGFINVDSEPGRGSAFKIYLPHHSVTVYQEPRALQTSNNLIGNETVLVVEDEISYLNIIQLMLEGYGYQVLTASTPEKALAVAKTHSGEIHLLLTDLVLPEMNGRVLADEISSLRQDILCLFMSGYPGDAIVQQCVLDESVNFIHKPFLKQALATKLREILDSK